MEYDLVFEGGGAKGMVFVGALREFERQGHTFDRLLGTSAGAITATLLAAGFDSAEMLAALDEEIAGQSVFAGFMEAPSKLEPAELEESQTRELLRQLNLPLLPDFIEERMDDKIIKMLNNRPALRHILYFIEYGGWFSAQNFNTWLAGKLNSGFYRGAPRNFGALSLEEFYQETQVALSFVASDTTAHHILVLNHRTAPDCPLVWAVRMSMNIPFIWPEVSWQSAWGPYRGQDLSNHLIVDGGMLSNFPVELFVSKLPVITAVMGPKTNDNILGFLIDENLPVPGAEVATKQDGDQFSPASLYTVQRIKRLLDTMLQAHDKMVMEAFEEFVVRLPAEGYGTTEFDMSTERKSLLVAAGEESMRQYSAQQPALAKGISFSLDNARTALDNRVDRMAQRLLK